MKQTLATGILLFLTTNLVTSQRCEYRQDAIPKTKLDYADYSDEIPRDATFSIICNRIVLNRGEKLPVTEPGMLVNPASTIKFTNCTVPALFDGVFDTFGSVKYLHLESSNITELDAGTFSKMGFLEEIHLEHNDINQIPYEMMTNLPTLQVLNISHNDLVQIHITPWTEIDNLKKLSLSHNRLRSLPLTALILPELKILDLSNNEFTDFDVLMFSDLLKLEKMDLCHNLITSFVPNSFKNTIHLEILDISNNKISQIDFSVMPQSVKHLNLQSNRINTAHNWSALDGIQILDLQHNKIRTLERMPKNIEHLHLNWNKITKLNSSIFANASNLKELGLRHNLIAKIDRGAFMGLGKLVVLDLDYNEIDDIEEGTFSAIYEARLLNLSHNALTHVAHETFINLIHLEELDLSFNKLQSFAKDPFISLYSLQYLDVSHNMLQSFNVDGLLQEIPSVKKVALHGNAYSCEELVNTLSSFQLRFKYITVIHGNDTGQPNINGISCTGTINASVLHSFDEDINTVANSWLNMEKKINIFYKLLLDNPRFGNFSMTNSKNLNHTTLHTCIEKDHVMHGFFEMLETEEEKINADLKTKDFFNSDLLKDIDKESHDVPVVKFINDKLTKCSINSTNTTPDWEKELGIFYKILLGDPHITNFTIPKNMKNPSLHKCIEKDSAMHGFFELLETAAEGLDVDLETKNFFNDTLLKDIDKAFHNEPVGKFINDKIQNCSTNILPDLENKIEKFYKILSGVAHKAIPVNIEKPRLQQCIEKDHIVHGFFDLLKTQAEKLDADLKTKDFFNSDLLKAIDKEFHDVPVVNFINDKLTNCSVSAMDLSEISELLYHIKREQQNQANGIARMENNYKNLAQSVADSGGGNMTFMIIIIILVLIVLVLNTVKYGHRCFERTNGRLLNSHVVLNDNNVTSESRLELI